MMNKRIIPTIKKRATVFTGLFFLTGLFSGTAFSANIYVDQGAIESDATWSGVDGESYTSTATDFPGAGIGYGILEDALDNMSASDDIYLREGAYTPVGRYSGGLDNVDFYIDYNKSGTSDDHSSIQSFPGEWAVLEGSGNYPFVLGHGNQNKDGTYRINYWDISRLEIDGNGVSSNTWSGIGINGSHNSITYCYIHDNKNTTGVSGSTAGLILWIPAYTTVKYNYFDDNGCTSGANNCAQVDIIADYSYTHNNCTTYNDLIDGPYDLDWAVQGNEFAYNYFTIEAGTLIEGFVKYKSQQKLTPMLDDNGNISCSDGDILDGDLLVALDMTNKDFGDKWHHNVAPDQGAHLGQDFVQFYNNIVGGHVKLGPSALDQPINAVAYNNTLLGGPLRYSGMSGGYFNPAIGDGTQPMVVSLYNNLLASPEQEVYGGGTNDFLELSFLVLADAGITGQTYSGYFNVNRNYIYDPSQNIDSTNQVNMASVESTLAAFDSVYSFTNYLKSSSEGADNLFEGTSGADQYITRGAHVVSGAVTIANGGADTAHPYLSGVTIPKYIGATDPNNNGWVEQVLSLDAACMTSGQCGSSQPNAPGIPEDFRSMQ